MFPRLRGAWGPRRLAFAVVPAALGALLFLAGDRPPPGTSRLEATQGVAPRPLPGEQTTTVPAPPPPESPPGTLGILGEAVAAVVASDPAAAQVWQAAQAASAGGPTTTAASTAAGATDAFTAPATSDSSSAPRALSGETSGSGPGPAVTSTSTTATTAPPATTTTTAPPRSGPGRVPAVEAEVVPLTNGDRTANGLGTLSRDGCLDAAASRFAEQLARSGVLAHNPGAGAAVRDCRPNAAWGDNVGTSLPCSAAVLEERWMASQSHRRNILTGDFQYVGVGAWADSTGACWVQVLFSS